MRRDSLTLLHYNTQLSFRIVFLLCPLITKHDLLTKCLNKTASHKNHTCLYTYSWKMSSFPGEGRRCNIISKLREVNCQRIAKGAGGKGPRQKMSKIVKKCQKFFDAFRQLSHRAKSVKNPQHVSKCFRHFSTIFARRHFSGPFWGAQSNSQGVISISFVGR